MENSEQQIIPVTALCSRTFLKTATKSGKNKNKLVKWKALFDTVGIKSADLKQKFLFLSFTAFRTNCLDVGKDRRLLYSA